MAAGWPWATRSANLLAAQGAIVHREYYLNDAGNQLDTFAASLFARYEGREPPEDGYQGQYLIDMAAVMRAELGDAVTEEQAQDWGYRYNVRTLQDDLARIGVHFDTWFSERTLHEAGKVKRVLDDLGARGVVFDHDGATWLRTTDFGDQRDRVPGEVRRRPPPTCATTSRTTATSSSAGGSTSSTSGAPTTTGR